MTGSLILFVGLVYLITSSCFIYQGNIALAIVFGGYALSNVGLWMVS